MIFVFTGEFGYELLNWQGVVRKLRNKVGNGQEFIACSRRGMEHFYETCNRYIDISEIPTYKNSIANGYMSEGLNDEELKNGIAEIIGLKEFYNHAVLMSHHYRQYEGLTWGKGSIYGDIDMNNNVFTKIEPHLEVKSDIETQIGFSLNEPYVLVQTASRIRANKSSYKLPLRELVDSFPENIRIVLLGFNTMKNVDSHSTFDVTWKDNFVSFQAQTFKEQSCLIHHAQKRVFLTEGDYRSHIYLPPFMGLDVFAVAHTSVYELQTAPYEFWNRNVFRFGGKIIPVKLTDDLKYNQKLISGVISE